MSRQPSGWAFGFTAFAATMMILGGAWWIMAGIAALLEDNFYVVTEDYVFEFDVTTWGWIHLILGIVVLISGFALFSGSGWAKGVGVACAALSALVAFAWIPHYPVWGIIFLVLAVGVIWALVVHGDEFTGASSGKELPNL